MFEPTPLTTLTPEELVRQQRLIALGLLAGSISHELRNPLGSISNSVYLLQMILGEPDPEALEALQIIGTEVRRTTRIIQSLLDFARTGQSVLEAVEVNAIVREALKEVTLPENVLVTDDLDEDLSLVVGDSTQLSRVFANLILNALQAMPDGGELILHSALASEWLTVSVTDSGIGIPEDTLEKIFDPLFTTKPRGVGLGLVLAKILVEEGHGGMIEVQSQVGKGSTFTVKLPVRL